MRYPGRARDGQCGTRGARGGGVLRGRVQQLPADVHDVADDDEGRGGEIRRARIRGDALECRHQHSLLGQGRRGYHGRRCASGEPPAHQRPRNIFQIAQSHV